MLTIKRFGSLSFLFPFLFSFVLFFLIIFFPVFAEDSVVGDDGQVECFEYYKFGSVNVDVDIPRTSFPGGAVLPLSGNIENNNSYPIVDGKVLAKVYRIGSNNEIIENVDFFVAKEGVYLDSNSSVPVDFEWQIPRNTQNGNYKLVIYFTTSDKFNLQGLSFTDDISGNEVNFRIQSNIESGVYFDRETVSLDNKKYLFSSFSPVVPSNSQPVKLSAKINNDTNENKELKVLLDVYKWDALSDSNLVQTLSTTVNVNPKSAKEFSISLPFKDFSVYYVIVRLDDGGHKSLMGIRYIIDGKKNFRLNFPSLLNFPIEKNAETSFFACYHGMGMGGDYGGHLQDGAFEGIDMSVGLEKAIFNVSIKDASGKVINKFSTSGSVGEDMKAFIKKVNLQESYDYLDINVDMLVEGKNYDSVRLVYDCKQINAGRCFSTLERGGGVIGGEYSGKLFQKYKAIIIFVGLLILLLLVVLIAKYLNKKSINTFIFVLFMFSLNSEVQAGTITWNYTIPEMCDESIYGRWTDYWKSAGDCSMLFDKLAITVKNNYFIENASTGEEISCGSTVPVGTQLVVGYRGLESEDLCWNGTGGHLDTPCGVWNADASRIATQLCNSENFMRSYMDGVINPKIDGYLQMVGKRPNRDTTIVNSGNASCSDITQYGTTAELDERKLCLTDNSTGPIDIRFTVNSTIAKFYSGVIHRGARTPGITPAMVNVCRGTTFGSTRDRPGVNEIIYPVNTLTPYTLTVPLRQYNCRINVVKPTSAPILQINSVSQCVLGSNTDILVSTTDAENHKVRYILDLNDGTAVQIYPPSGYVSPGTFTIGKIFGELDGKDISIQAEDETGALSNVVDYTVECSDVCSFTNACGKQIDGNLVGGVCTPPSTKNINDSCVEDFSCDQSVGPNGSVKCKWRTSALTSDVTRTCGFVDLTTITPRPIPGMQNLSLEDNEATINNIQRTTRFCLVCNFYKAGSLIGNTQSHQWVKVIQIGED